jgi:hypothetical protein
MASNPAACDFRHLGLAALAEYHICMEMLRAAIAASKKWKLDRIISIATLLTSVIALVLVLKRPAPVAAPQTPAQAAANAQSFQEKLSQLDRTAPTEAAQSQNTASSTNGNPDSQLSVPSSQSAPSAAQVHITSEVSAALAQAAGGIPAVAGQLSPGGDLGSMPNIIDQQVSFDGDQVHGQFLTTVAGKNVWVTVAGHLGSKDGYATFEPTEFKVGDLNVPVSLVNDALQKRLAEQRDRMKLPDSIGGMKVENGQLVLTQK